jgi:hypothetical protein
MTIDPALVFSILMPAFVVAGAGPAMAQACTREGPVVTCDDGRRGFAGRRSDHLARWHAIGLSPHPSVIVGNKSSMRVGPGVFAGKGVVPRDDPNAPNKRRCAVLWLSYCY